MLNAVNRLFKTAKDLFSLDLRSLALFRMGTALILICDLGNRSRDLVAHYTDFGVLPRAALMEHFANKWHISVHLFAGTWPFQVFFFGLALTLAVTLFLGLYTRFSTILSWLFLISLHSRNPMVLQGGDVLLRMMLFWGMFLPWGKRLSVDGLWQSRSTQTSILTVGSGAYLLQIAILYFFAGYLKSGPEWSIEGSAIYYALSLDQFRLPLGDVTFQFPSLMQYATFVVYYFELLYPLILFFPFQIPMIRTALVGATILLHFSFGSHIWLGHFPWIGSVSVLAFLPSKFWQYRWPNLFTSFTENGLRTLFQTASIFRIYNRWQFPTVTMLKRPSHWAWQTTGGILLIYIILWNSGDAFKVRLVPRNIHWVAHLLRIDQEWAMFAPAPMKDDGWYVIPAKRFKDDKPAIDLMKQGSQITWEKPESVRKMFTNFRWRKYYRNIWLKKNTKHRLYLGRYLCRSWNTTHRGLNKIDTFEIFFMKEKTLLDYQTEAIEKVSIWTHYCYKKPKKIAD